MTLSDCSASQSRCLLLGAKGAGMTALAEILNDQNHVVTGLDHQVSASDLLNSDGRRRWKLLPWSDAFDAQGRFDECVASPAVPSDHPILNQLQAGGVTVTRLPQRLSRAFRDRRQLCVAGTHGKTTTAAMLAWILERCGRRPGYFIGGYVEQLQRSGCWSSGEDAVLESCEFSNSFHHLNPNVLLLTGIERDHFDCFPRQQDEDTAFRRFAQQLPENGSLVFNADCARTAAVAERVRCQQISYQVVNPEVWSSQHCNADWTAENVQVHPVSAGLFEVPDSAFPLTTFQLKTSQGSIDVQLSVPGLHNVRNALGAIAAAAVAGVDPAESAQTLSDFRGVRRRFEWRGQFRESLLIDDYAHHPGAIQATLQTARQLFPDRRLVAVFEPHQMVRTEALFPAFADSLLLADEVLLLPVFAAREDCSLPRCCQMSGQLVREVNQRGGRAFLFANLDQVVSRIDDSARPADLILTMGAGRTNLIHDELTGKLQRHSVA
ncbi:MAG: Mur ligase family protein [Planctomycetaceae bacterium]